MSLVNVTNMAVLNNPSPFSSPLLFEITFECLQELTDDLEWKVLYVGSAESSKHDQVLDEILVGPVPVGINKFVLQADAPDRSCIPDSDLLGVTVLLVTCSYREQEFARVGYYVSNEYTVPYDAEVGPPKPLDVEKVQRTILADKPRVTRFPINWGDEQQQQQQTDTQQEQEQLNDDLIDENEEEEEEEEEDVSVSPKARDDGMNVAMLFLWVEVVKASVLERRNRWKVVTCFFHFWMMFFLAAPFFVLICFFNLCVVK
uniref:Anti-silencing function protein 1 n=1 Tax=Ditylum brightwellii TaxID=49249 RepID=A0A6U3URN5_9STRA|mmetsp:Transcript_6011/g.9121  ORF Transcript_6011/g.9121 Transcript_6011/m.9121 type:complete len:259 (+) Transcript_6011:31-807(+)